MCLGLLRPWFWGGFQELSYPMLCHGLRIIHYWLEQTAVWWVFCKGLCPRLWTASSAWRRNWGKLWPILSQHAGWRRIGHMPHIRNTSSFRQKPREFWMAQTAQTEPWNLRWGFTSFPSRCVLISFTLRLACGDLYAPSEEHMCYTMSRGCSHAAAGYTMPGNVYTLLWPSATFYLSAIGIYRMPHSLHTCWPLRWCRLVQYSLHPRYIACNCICLPMIIFYRSEIYCPIVTLPSTMPSDLHILCWCIIRLRCVFLLICICIVAILAHISVEITGCQVKPAMPSVLHILRWSIISLRCFFLLILIHIIANLTLIPVDITRSQMKPLMFSCGI